MTDGDTFLEPLSRPPSQEFLSRSQSQDIEMEDALSPLSQLPEGTCMYDLCTWFLYLYKQPEEASDALDQFVQDMAEEDPTIIDQLWRPSEGEGSEGLMTNL